MLLLLVTQRKRKLMQGITKEAGDRFLLTRGHIIDCFNNYGLSQQSDRQVLLLLCWWYLLRVPSEGLLLQKGSVSMESGLPTCVSSGVWLGLDGKLVLRLNQRKNRPRGCHLRRGCECAEHAEICPVHVLAPLLQQYRTGQRVSNITGVAMSRVV